MQTQLRFAVLLLVYLCTPFSLSAGAQEKSKQEALDDRVKEFLEQQRSSWNDMNIPWRDGQFLYDVIIQNRYTRALEIGTSTGHSAIWIAWALSKTGGRLITIEIDEGRHKLALENFRKAGLSDLIDARLADAHDLVRELKGPFDFVFSDADKYWYRQYFIDLAPKITPGGCYATHNISISHGEFRGNTKEYMDYLKSLPDFETSVEDSRSSGIAVSYKKRKVD
jgi:caffeoyl-CoA O-methyltransferase